MSDARVRPVRLRVLGRLVPPLMSVGTAGGLIGLSRTHSYVVARRDSWPMDHGRVLGPPFFDRFGLSYEVVVLDTDPNDSRLCAGCAGEGE